jgi:hypothetical protein
MNLKEKITEKGIATNEGFVIHVSYLFPLLDLYNTELIKAMEGLKTQIKMAGMSNSNQEIIEYGNRQISKCQKLLKEGE